MRVIQRNLVYIIGLSPSLTNEKTVSSADFFGKYGKIRKVVINKSSPYNSSQGVSYSAYITYANETQATLCIRAVDGYRFDGRNLKATFGTTKYCNFFLRGQKCPKGDCLYLHEEGSQSDSFTSEEIKHNKHVQPHNSIFGRLRVTVESCGTNQLPSAYVQRPRYFSEDHNSEPKKPRLYSIDLKKGSRFWFVEEGAEENEVPPLQDLLSQVSPNENVVELPANQARQILEDTWYADVLKFETFNQLSDSSNVLLSSI